MIRLLICMSACITTGACNAELSALGKYESFLNWGTYYGHSWRRGNPDSRYATFKKAFELFKQNNGKTIVILGGIKSFVHPQESNYGTNDTTHWQQDNPQTWDWTDGLFARMAAECLAELKPTIYVVDPCIAHVKRTQIMTKPWANLFDYNAMPTISFMANYPHAHGIDLLYVDSGGMTPQESVANLQSHEVHAAVSRNIMAPHGVIIIDDVMSTEQQKFGDNKPLGKSKYAIPYLINHGFRVALQGYQVVLYR